MLLAKTGRMLASQELIAKAKELLADYKLLGRCESTTEPDLGLFRAFARGPFSIHVCAF